MAKSLANFTQRQRGIVEQGWVPGLEPLRSPEPPWAVTLLSRHPSGSFFSLYQLRDDLRCPLSGTLLPSKLSLGPAQRPALPAPGLPG